MRLTRRRFVVMATMMLGAQACAPAAPAQPTAAPAKPAESKPAEAAKPAAPAAAAPTTAPAAAAKPAEVAKPAVAAKPAEAAKPAAPAPASRTPEIVYASIYDPRTLDPAKDDAAFTLMALRQLYDGLVVQDASGKIYPHLAESWSPSADNLTWTFKLRNGVKFHDGTPFNSAAVKFSFDRVMDEKTASPAGGRWRNALKSVEAPDPNTVVVTLKDSFPPFLGMMSSAWAYIVSPTAVQKDEKEFGNKPVGTGAFTFGEWQKQDRLVLKANMDYAWGPPFLQNKGAPYVDRLVFRQIPQMTALGASMETGEVQLLGFIDVPNMERLNGMGHSSQIIETPSAGWIYYINTQKAPTTDLKVRQAIGYAINNKEASDTPLWRGDGLPIYGPFNPMYPWNSQKAIDEFGFKFDPEKSKALLDEAGWKMGSDGIREKNGEKLSLVDVTNSETPRYVGSAQIVQAQLKAVGIQSNIKAETQATFSQAQARGEHNIAIRASVGDDPSSILGTMLASSAIGVSGQNLSRYSNPEVDQLLAEGLKEYDEKKRFAIYEKIQAAALRDAAIVPFLSRRFLFSIDKRLQGVAFDPTPTLYGHDLRLS